MTDGLIGKFGYLGIILLLVLGGLGVPIPEEAPIILSAVLSHKGAMDWPLALAACFFGVLLGDFIVYYLGYFYGEKVLSLPLTRKFLTRPREEQIKGYFHRHGVKILILGRFAVGFRTAAYLTAGILRLPALRLLVADLFAATLSTLLMFGLGYWFADRIERGLEDFKHYLMVFVAISIAGWLLYRYHKARKLAGRAVGPPVLVTPDDVPLPPDDLSAQGLHKVTRPPATTISEGGSVGRGSEELERYGGDKLSKADSMHGPCVVEIDSHDALDAGLDANPPAKILEEPRTPQPATETPIRHR